MNSDPVDVRAIRGHFAFPGRGRIVTNNAASTQPPRELLALYASLAPGYENVHRGQSTASGQMTARFEAVDYLAFSFHKMLAPFGVGVLGSGKWPVSLMPDERSYQARPATAPRMTTTPTAIR